MKKGFFLFIFLNFLIVINSYALSSYKDSKTIVNKIAQIARETNSIVGVSAIHIESNKSISYNGKKLCFMASTVKIPIALTLLHRVDLNQESLERIVQLNAQHAVPGSGNLYFALDKGPVKVSIWRLLSLMMINSDNSASDVILKLVNGPRAVRERLSNLGFQNIHIKHTLLENFFAASGADHKFLSCPHSYKSLEILFKSVPLSKKVQAWKSFEKDLSDSTTPDDMALLLAKLYKQQLLSATNTKLLIKLMQESKTGKGRIKKLLPPHALVAHKTGTWTIYSPRLLSYPPSKQLFRFASDVGIITLLNNKGHIAIAVYVKSKSIGPQRNRVIAQISKLIYDYFS